MNRKIVGYHIDADNHFFQHSPSRTSSTQFSSITWDASFARTSRAAMAECSRRPRRSSAAVWPPWQERRAKALLSNSLTGEMPLAKLAREFGLSANLRACVPAVIRDGASSMAAQSSR
jgi:hypothetical protein